MRPGCTGPHGEPFFTIPCGCGGFNKACKRCGGSAEVAVNRCLLKLLEPHGPRARGLQTAFATCQFYILHGTLPGAGGLMDQTAWFFELLKVVTAEKGRVDGERLREAEQGSDMDRMSQAAAARSASRMRGDR